MQTSFTQDKHIIISFGKEILYLVRIKYQRQYLNGTFTNLIQRNEHKFNIKA